MYKKIVFYLKEILIYQCKFDTTLYKSIVRCANPSTHKTLEKLWKKILFYRYITILLELTSAILTFWGNILVIEKKLDVFVIFLLLRIVHKGISSGYANYIQDSLLVRESIFTDTLTRFRTKFSRVYPEESIEMIQKTITDIIHCERFKNLTITLILQTIALVLSLKYTNTVFPALLIIFYCFLMFFLVTVIAQLMSFFGKKFRIMNDQIRILHNTENYLFKSVDFQSHIRQIQPDLLKMAFVKASANVDNILLTLLFVFSYTRIYGGKEIAMLIVIINFIDPILNYLLTLLQCWPKVISMKKDVLYPIINTLRTKVPSPLTQPKSNLKKDSKIKSILLSNIRHRFPDSNDFILDLPEIELFTNGGIYTVTGDSGQGKSIFLNILGNELFPIDGQVSLKFGEQSVSYNQIGYWKLRNLIRYIWISNIEFPTITTLQLFRTCLADSRNCYFTNVFNGNPDNKHIKKLLSQKSNLSYVSNPLLTPTNNDQHYIDEFTYKLLVKILIDSGLFREEEKHIINLEIDKLSGGQHARLITAFYLVSPLQIVLLDESLERTTKDSSHSKNCKTNSNGNVIYTRDRMINFIGEIIQESKQTVFLLIQGEDAELLQIKKVCGALNIWAILRLVKKA